MPNRGPLKATCGDLKKLMAELPPPRDLKEAEDDEDRLRIKMMATIHGRIGETVAALQAEDEEGTVVFSIEEMDEILDCMPPPPTLAAVREKLGDLRRQTLEGA